MDPVTRRIAAIGIVPIATIERAADAARIGEALLAGGLKCVEITFRTPAAAEAIAQISEACPDILVGAGTLLTLLQAEEAVAAGALSAFAGVRPGNCGMEPEPQRDFLSRGHDPHRGQ